MYSKDVDKFLGYVSREGGREGGREE